MITRIVRMSFREDEISNFLVIFKEANENIRKSPGCRYLELLRDLESPNVFLTLSRWDSLQDLDNYKKSAVFKTTWKKTKALFKEKPIVYTTKSVVSMP